MSFDIDVYTREVLEPARAANNTIPVDLWVRYALTEDVLGPGLQAHLDEVVKFWRSQVQTRKFRGLANALLADHVALTADLTPERLRASRVELQKHARERLARAVEPLAATASLITTEQFDELLAQCDGIGEGEVREALADKGVSVAAPPALPETKPTGKFHALLASLNSTGNRLSVNLLYGKGCRFRLLNGFVLEGAGDSVASVVARMRAEEDLLGTGGNIQRLEALRILEEVTRKGRYDELLKCELMEAVGGLRGPQRFHKTLTSEAMDLGLVGNEAALLALALLQEGVDDPVDVTVRDIEQLLGAGELRAAEQRVAALTVGDDPRVDAAITRVRQAAQRVDELVARAEADMKAGRTEDAAEQLASATRLAADDDDLPRRLGQLAPPPPSNLRAVIVGDDVQLSWQPSAARVGEISYRIVRGTSPISSPASGIVVAETDAVVAKDPSPPVASDLHYAVFATRCAGQWTPPAIAGPVVVVPELSNVQLTVGPRSVSATWGVSERAVEVAVVRRKDRPPKHDTDGTVVREKSLQGFTDTSVTTGQTYHYRAAAVYVTSSGLRLSTPGVVVSATPERAAEPVEDLDVALHLGGQQPQVELSWTEPAGGRVTIVRADAPPPWSSGSIIGSDELAGYGTSVGGRPESTAGQRMRLRVPPHFGRNHFTAFCASGTTAIVGNTVPFTMVEPVRGLSAERLDREVRLSWEWPDRSTSCTVRWWPTSTAESEAQRRTVSRRAYEDEGGYTIPAQGVGLKIVVQATIDETGGAVTSAPASLELRPSLTEIHYSITRRRKRRQLLATIRFCAETPCELPPVEVVRSQGRVMPLAAEAGSVVSTVPGQRLDPGAPLEVEIEVAAVKGPDWIVCFPRQDAPSSDVVLVAPPARELMAR